MAKKKEKSKKLPSMATWEKWESMNFVVPAEILLNNSLTKSDIRVYIIVSNLTHKKGFCWAANDYIAKLLDISVRQVEYSIRNLRVFKYIICGYRSKNNNTQRYIFDNFKAKKIADFKSEYEDFTEEYC